MGLTGREFQIEVLHGSNVVNSCFMPLCKLLFEGGSVLLENGTVLHVGYVILRLDIWRKV